jgi:hypothetical protein
MSSLHNANQQYLGILNQDLGIDPDTDIPIVAGWIYIPNVSVLTFSTVAWSVRTGSSTPALNGQIRNLTGEAGPRSVVDITSTSSPASSIPEGQWGHVAVAYGPWDAQSHNQSVWANGGTAGTSSHTSATGPFSNLNNFFVGSQDSNNTYLHGRVAEVAIYKNVGDTPSLLTALQTKTPDHEDCLAIATPIFYRPLLSDTTGGIGEFTIVNNNSVTFDSGTHPTLTGPSGPAARSRMMLVAI